MPSATWRSNLPARFSVAALAVVQVVTVLVANAVLAAGPAAAAECVGPWQPVGMPSALYGMEPQGVATVGGQPAWVVGLASALVKGNRAPMIAQWNGSGWVRTAGPWNKYGILKAVETNKAANAWAVGSIGSYTRWPAVARWRGSSWSDVPVPHPDGQLAILAGLALIKGQKLWAVGTRLSDGRTKPVAIKHTRSGWTTHDPVLTSDAEGGLADVTRAPGGRIWAAGWRTDQSGQGRAWIVDRRNGAWHTYELDAVPAGRAAITDLAFRGADDAWAAGFVETLDGYQPILQHWDGRAWTNEAVPWANGRSIILNAVEAATDGSLTVAGMEVQQLRNDVLATRRGSSWQVASISSGSIDISNMADVARLGSAVLAAGAIERQPITMFPCPGGGTASVVDSVPGTQTSASDAALHDDEISPQELSVGPDTPAPLATVTIPGTVASDVTQAAGLQMSVPTWSGVVADFNDDGHPDVFVNRHWEAQPVLMLGSSAGTFSALATNQLVVDRHRCAAADVDHSGLLDLYCAVGVNKGTTNTPNELTLDLADSGGTWASTQFGLLDGFGRARDVTFLDIDDDGYLDVFLSNEGSRADAMWSSNRLYRNLDGHGFAPAPEWGLDHPFGFGVAMAVDLDGDGDDDLLTRASVRDADGRAGARVYINDGGQFHDRTAQLGLEMPGLVEMEAADFDGDHRLDVVQLTHDGLHVFLARGSSFQQAYQLAFGQGVAMAVGDVDGDDRPDIYVARRTAGNAGHLMLVNRDQATSFVSMGIPEPGAGRADDVLAIDYDGNGRTDFLTFNGWSVDGPLKLTAFYPAP